MNKVKRILIIVFAVIFIIVAVRFINAKRFAIPEDFSAYIMGPNIPEEVLAQEGMTISVIQEGYLNGYHLVPKVKTTTGLVVTFGGSDGSCDITRAIALAKEGFEVTALYFFGQENQPPLYNNVPLEFFGDFLDYAKENCIDTSVLSLSGISKGAELSLVLSHYYSEIDNLILFAPTSFVFQGGDMMEKTSSWEYKGESFPYISLFPNFVNGFDMTMRLMLNLPIAYYEHQKWATEVAENRTEAMIDFTNFKGDILAFVGGDDQVWPSDIMGKMIKDAAPTQTELIVYEDAGHAFYPIIHVPGMDNGGTIGANTKAQIDSDKRMLEFLQSKHSLKKRREEVKNDFSN